MRGVAEAVSVILEVASFILIAPEFITDATLTAIQGDRPNC
jgi:hypothetical protein